MHSQLASFKKLLYPWWVNSGFANQSRPTRYYYPQPLYY